MHKCVLASFFVLISIVLILSNTQAFAEPNLSLVSTTGKIGDKIEFVTSGFNPHGQVTIYWDHERQPVGYGIPLRGPGFFTVPEFAIPGLHTIRADGGCGGIEVEWGCSAFDNFTVIGGGEVSGSPFGNTIALSPLKQFKSGIVISDIKCKKDYVLVIKLSNENPVCVKPSHVTRFLAHGWFIPQIRIQVTNGTNSTMPAQNQTNGKPISVTEVIQNIDSLYNKTISVYGYYSQRYPFPSPMCASYLHPHLSPIYHDSFYMPSVSGHHYLLNVSSSLIPWVESVGILEVKIIDPNTNTTITGPAFEEGRLVSFNGILIKQYVPPIYFCTWNGQDLYKSAYLLANSKGHEISQGRTTLSTPSITNTTVSSKGANSIKILSIIMHPDPVRVGSTPIFLITYQNISDKVLYNANGCTDSSLHYSISSSDHVQEIPWNRACDIFPEFIQPNRTGEDEARSAHLEGLYKILKPGTLHVTMDLALGNRTESDMKSTTNGAQITIMFNVNATQ